MAVKSRRKAREAALRALYEIEISNNWVGDAIQEAATNADLDETMRAYHETLVWGVERERKWLDGELEPLLHDYGIDRLAAVDRNVLRLAAYEISFEPSIPPAVTVNEAVEIAKKYSTAESGRFVNGVLAKYLQKSAKANWTAESAPPEQTEEPPSEVEPEETAEMVAEDSPEAVEARKIGAWRLKESSAE